VNVETAPDGTLTAEKLIEDTQNGAHYVNNPTASFTATAANYTLSCFIKAAERTFAVLGTGGLGGETGFPAAGIAVDLSTGTITATNGTFSNPLVTSFGNGWWRCSITVLGTASTGRFWIAMAQNGTSADIASIGYTGNDTSGIYIWGAQLELGSTATAFQNIGTDKMTVWGGVTKLSDAAIAVLVELSASRSTNDGSYTVLAPAGPGANYTFSNKGTSEAGAAATVAAPSTNVLSCIGDIANDITTLRNNGAVAQTNTANLGTGNYGNYPLYIGRRANSSLPLNGRIYQLIVRGAASNATQISGTEQYVAGKTGVAL